MSDEERDATLKGAAEMAASMYDANGDPAWFAMMTLLEKTVQTKR